MDTGILLSFLKEISAETDLERVRRFLDAFLRNFFKGYLSFDVFIGEKEEEIKPLFRKYENENKIKDFLFSLKEATLYPVGSTPFNEITGPECNYLFYFPFYHFGKLFGFILIDFRDNLSEEVFNDLKLLSSFIGPLFFSSYLHKKRKESIERLELSYDLVLFSTRVLDEDRLLEYVIKNIYENIQDIESVCFYRVKGNVLIPVMFRGKREFEILNIEFSFPGEAIKKMKTVLKERELAILVPTKDFVHGVLYIKRKRGIFDEEEIKTFEMISNTLSIAIENINFIKEIRERKETLEEEIKYLVERRSQEEKMAFIGKVTAGLIHELKNLISGVLGVSEIIELKVKDEKIKELIKALKEEGEIMNYILISLLEISKPFKLNITLNFLNEIVQKIVSISHFFVKGKNIEFFIDIPDDIKLLCDEIKFELTLLNLIKNSIEAIEKEGKIFINFKKNKDFVLEIEDTGKGIESKYLDKIFEPFFTTKEKGAGLGLSFVKKVIEAHGFTIDVSSIIGKGTKFMIHIPEKFIKGSNPIINKKYET